MTKIPWSETLRLYHELIEPISERYFGTTHSADGEKTLDLIKKEQVIFIANHSGMSFPWDGMCLVSRIVKLFGTSSFPLSALTSPFLLRTRIMNHFLVPGFWRKLGAVEANMENFERALAMKENVLIFPEGISGIGKGYSRRYQVQKFSSSFVRMAQKHNVKIVPVYMVNAENFHPWSFGINWLNRVLQKFGIPFLPLSPFFPFLALIPIFFYLALPAPVHIRFGKPIDAPDPDLAEGGIHLLTQKIQRDFQINLDKTLGLQGLQAKQSALGLIQWHKLFHKIGPFAWPRLFHSVQCRPEMESWSPFARIFLLCIYRTAFFMPVLGWPLLWLAHQIETQAIKSKSEPFLYWLRSIQTRKFNHAMVVESDSEQANSRLLVELIQEKQKLSYLIPGSKNWVDLQPIQFKDGSIEILTASQIPKGRAFFLFHLGCKKCFFWGTMGENSAGGSAVKVLGSILQISNRKFERLPLAGADQVHLQLKASPSAESCVLFPEKFEIMEMSESGCCIRVPNKQSMEHGLFSAKIVRSDSSTDWFRARLIHLSEESRNTSPMARLEFYQASPKVHTQIRNLISKIYLSSRTWAA